MYVRTRASIHGHNRSYGQAGFSLIETLVSIALIGILLAALTGSVITMRRVSMSANSSARANALMTATGESLKQLEYIPCEAGNLVDAYNSLLETRDANLPIGERLVSDPAFEAVSVTRVDTFGGCTLGATDTGRQTLVLAVNYRGTERVGQIVKRGEPSRLQAVITPELLNTTTAPIVYYRLTGSGSTPLEDIDLFEWACGDPSSTTYSTNDPSDPAVECHYVTGNSSTTDYTATLKVTDKYGNVAQTTRTFTLGPTASPIPPPNPSFTVSPASGAAPLNVSFNPSASTPGRPEGAIVKYEWDFADSFDPSGSKVTTTTAAIQTHRYQIAGSYNVRLKVTDDTGRSATTNRMVTVNPPPVPTPGASFTFSPGRSVSPQTVRFDASASTPGRLDRPIVNYDWSFPDGTGSGGVTPSKLFSAPGSYAVTLTVTDSAGTTASITKTVKVDAFINPVNFRLTGTKPEFFSDGEFHFAWTNDGASSGDTVTYEIRIQVVEGCLVFGTKSRTVPAGAPGTNQTYKFIVSWPASNVCAGSQYAWQVRTVRHNATEGTRYTDWTTYKHFWMV